MNASYFKNIPILTYHKVSDDSEVGLTTVSPAEFERHMRYLYDHNFQTITPNEYDLEVSNPIIISFDDAYESVYLNALPIMKKFNFKGLIFVITDYIGKQNTWDANLASRTFSHLTHEHINELIENGWEIGSHTESHKTLRLNNIEEIVNSKYKLEELFSIKVTSFSYPFGTSTKKSLEIVSKHYDFGFKATPLNSSRYLIGRSSVYSFDRCKDLIHKINLSKIELIKLRLINQGAKATEIGQIIKLI